MPSGKLFPPCAGIHREPSEAPRDAAKAIVMAQKRKKKTIPRYLTRTYKTWINMRQRCRNPNNPNWDDYGGRGIKVCKRWDVYENFLEDLGYRPGDGWSLERIDCNKNYCPSNCRWIENANQWRERRVTILVNFHGKKFPLRDICQMFQLNYMRAYHQVKRGLTIEAILSRANGKKSRTNAIR